MPARTTVAASWFVPGSSAVPQRAGAYAAAQSAITALRLFCHACRCGRPAPGFSRYAAYQLCELCATEFEVAQRWTERPSVGQFVRDKQFGEADRYVVADA